MKQRQFLIFTLTAMLDIIMGCIIIEVLAMIYMCTLPIESIMTIVFVVPFIIISEYVINKLKKQELKRAPLFSSRKMLVSLWKAYNAVCHLKGGIHYDF